MNIELNFQQNFRSSSTCLLVTHQKKNDKHISLTTLGEYWKRIWNLAISSRAECFLSLPKFKFEMVLLKYSCKCINFLLWILNDSLWFPFVYQNVRYSTCSCSDSSDHRSRNTIYQLKKSIKNKYKYSTIYNTEQVNCKKRQSFTHQISQLQNFYILATISPKTNPSTVL